MSLLQSALLFAADSSSRGRNSVRSTAAAIVVSAALGVLPASARADDLPTFDLSTFTVSDRISGVGICDCNNDGLDDLVVCFFAAGTTIYFNNPANPGTFHDPINFPLNNFTSTVAIDLNNDGWTDLVLHNPSAAVALFGNPPGSLDPLQAAFDLQVGGNVVFGDFNQDGWPDIAKEKIYLNQGPAQPGTFGGGGYDVYPGVPFASYIIGVGDFNADGWPDVVLPNSPSLLMPTVGTYINNQNSTFTPIETFSRFEYGSDPGRVLVSADFNRDGRADFALNHSGPSSSLTMFLAKGAPNPADGRMAPQSNKGGLYSPINVVVKDFNLDGTLDILESGSATSNQHPLILLLNSPPPVEGFAFRHVPLTGVITSSRSAAGDFNADGKPDIAAVNVSTTAPFTVSVLLNTTGLSCPADLNTDTFVDDIDFVIFAQAYDMFVCP